MPWRRVRLANLCTDWLKQKFPKICTRNQTEEDEKSYVRRERSSTCSRSYYVGNGVESKDVKAKYSNGTLSIDLPKKVEKLNNSDDITIE